MRRFILSAFTFILYIVIAHETLCQNHDFDSLMAANPAFKDRFQNIADTVNIFNHSSPLVMTLKTDIKNLIKQKFEDEYQPAELTIDVADTIMVTRSIKVKPRGNMRKKTCFMPPLKLNFPQKKAFLKQLQEFDKFKMVLDCKRGNTYEQYLLSEYYAYKILNIINDYSLKVKLAHVTYIDVSEKYKDVSRYAFLIEDINELAKRKNAIRIDPPNINDLLTDKDVLADTYLFQYLIGNTDWSIIGKHNIYFVKSDDPELYQPFAIPYDFDYAGIVNTTYAVPDEQLGIESVRERVYRGMCIDNDALMQSRQRFIQKKEAIYKLYEEDTLLSKNNKRDTFIYLDSFFSLLENDRTFNRNIVEVCR